MSAKLFDRWNLILFVSGFFFIFINFMLSSHWFDSGTAERPGIAIPMAALSVCLLFAMQVRYQVKGGGDKEDPLFQDRPEQVFQETINLDTYGGVKSSYDYAPVGLITFNWEKDLVVHANKRMIEMLEFHDGAFPCRAADLWANPLSFKQFIADLHDKRSVQYYACELKSRSGQIIKAEAFASCQEHSVHIEACFINITEKFHSLNFTKTQFLANMNHEIRTPMIGILGSVNLLEQSSLDHNQLDNVTTIRECGEHLLGVINEILDVSRIELGIESLVYESCNLVEIFTQTVSLIEPSAKEKGLTVSLDLQEPFCPVVLTDPTKLRQILLNLLYNAIKFTDHGGIQIQARLDNQGTPMECLFATIHDTGIGIELEKMETIFEPFTQGDSSSSRIFGGTGLGLYICRRLVELLEGDIWAESEKNQGTMFFVRIPVQAINEIGHNRSSSESSIKQTYIDDLTLTFEPIQVLLVEDNKINHRIVSQMLVNYGFEVYTAEHGLEALRLMQDKRFDVVLMDMQMPVMDGYEATRYICSDPDLSSTPVIAMTAHALAGDREKCIECGCSDYIAKPFRIEDLIEVINRNLYQAGSTPPALEDSYVLLLNQLLPEFMDSLSDMIQNLYSAMHEHDFDAVQSISHDIKGTAGIYGFKPISELAAHIELAAKQNKPGKVINLAATLCSLHKQLHEQVS